jgi:beta-glucuronidase
MTSPRTIASSLICCKEGIGGKKMKWRTFMRQRVLSPDFLLLSALLFLASVTAAIAQQPLNTLLVDVDHRPAISLDGPWHYLVDMTGANLYTPQGEIRDNTYALNQHLDVSGPTKPAEYNFATAPTLNVPGDWNTQDPTLFRYEGVIWYERNFDFQPKPGIRTFLHIGAANYRSHVWVNGKRLCDHEGGFTPFDCEATQVLHSGSNFVVIAVDSTRLVDGIPALNYDWYNYGGLTRDVSLVAVPAHFIDDYDAHLVSGTSNKISGYVHVEGASAGLPVTIKVPEAHLATTVTTDADGRAAFDLTANSLSLWSPGSPKLYKLEIAAGQDTLNDDVGFRDIRVEGTHILLNGKPIYLRGVCVQGEAPYHSGRVYSEKDVDTLLAWVHQLHANFIRLAHYPNDERMLRAADRQGIMVWSEIPLWQHIAFDNPEVYTKADFMLHEMIRRDRDKASILFWSVANETPNNPTRTEFLTRLVEQAHALDASRPVTAALNTARLEGSTMTLTDPLAQVLDVVGVNEYIGWYQGEPTLADTVTWDLPQKPIIMSEFGAEAKAGNHGTIARRWTEEYQANVYRHQIDMFHKIPQLRGTTPWILMDFRSPTRNLPLLQDGYNRKGLISDQGVKKQAFFIMQKAYEDGAVGKPN